MPYSSLVRAQTVAGSTQATYKFRKLMPWWFQRGGGPIAPGQGLINAVSPVVTATSLSVAGTGTATCTSGTWNGPATITYTYQWLRSGVVIAGATTGTHALVSADIGSLLSCNVKATNPTGNVTVTSNSIGPVVA